MEVCVFAPGHNSMFWPQFASRFRNKFCPCCSEHTLFFPPHYPKTQDQLRRTDQGSVTDVNEDRTGLTVLGSVRTFTPGVEEQVQVVRGAGEQQLPLR